MVIKFVWQVKRHVDRFLLDGRIIEEVGLRMLEHSYVLVSVLIHLVGDNDPTVAEKSISTGTTFFRSILEKMETQVHTVSQVGYLVVCICCFEIPSWDLFKNPTFGVSIYQQKYILHARSCWWDWTIVNPWKLSSCFHFRNFGWFLCWCYLFDV